MKIHHPNGIQPHINPQRDDAKTKGVGQADDFASVLKKTAAKSRPSIEMQASLQGQSIQHNMAGVELGQHAKPENSAIHLLDTLEAYQRLLADPSANLKQVQPAVDRMKAVAIKSESLVDKVPSGNMIKDVIKETLLQINKEIVRFESGEYVDD